jgi:hypothetical protein
MSAINKNDSFFGSFDIFIAGKIAPNKFPKWGVPVLCTPVKIFDIYPFLFFLGDFDLFDVLVTY